VSCQCAAGQVEAVGGDEAKLRMSPRRLSIDILGSSVSVVASHSTRVFISTARSVGNTIPLPRRTSRSCAKVSPILILFKFASTTRSKNEAS
jgi:hypothetical protein